MDALNLSPTHAAWRDLGPQEGGNTGIRTEIGLQNLSVLSRQTLGGTAEFEELSSSRLSSPGTDPPPFSLLLHLPKNFFSYLNFFLF